ncbi:unnamed protein product [Cuscuta campestris]|uniref:Uncharacterized protein n=1 Tax=Cuscuta campestris TaxID=132261 RepID=A0A484MAN1_9ASTE|nr:unnamed protein product [Cuscuta campestris]
MPFVQLKVERTWFLGILTIGFVGGACFITTFLRTATTARSICETGGMVASPGNSSWAEAQTEQAQLLEAILHYATSRLTPQQTAREIQACIDVLRRLGPANFLVFGLGHDSLMWKCFNLHGTTVFLEEDPKFYDSLVGPGGPNTNLTAFVVRYTTKMSEAAELVQHFREEQDCSAARSFLRGNHRCRLALSMLPAEVYDREWDVILIDGPRGYYMEAPGRMASIYSAAVMARNRKRPGVTHVFLHDVNRKVEKVYAELFLCRKYLVSAVGNLWHFEIPPAPSPHLHSNFC